jgi:carbon storage regulator CsrA
MLVLTRKLHETIRIGPDITITIVRVKGSTVRVGIEAPESVRVVRGELIDSPPRNASASSDEGPQPASSGDPSDGPHDRPASQPRGSARRRMPASAQPMTSAPAPEDATPSQAARAITEAGSRVRALLARRSRCFRPTALTAPLCQ